MDWSMAAAFSSLSKCLGWTGFSECARCDLNEWLGVMTPRFAASEARPTTLPRQSFACQLYRIN